MNSIKWSYTQIEILSEVLWLKPQGEKAPEKAQTNEVHVVNEDTGWKFNIIGDSWFPFDSFELLYDWFCLIVALGN